MTVGECYDKIMRAKIEKVREYLKKEMKTVLSPLNVEVTVSTNAARAAYVTFPQDTQFSPERMDGAVRILQGHGYRAYVQCRRPLDGGRWGCVMVFNK